MSDEDLIAAMHQAVKREIIDRYLNERLVLEEELSMVMEAASAFHGGMARVERQKACLAQALVSKEATGVFFSAAGLALPNPLTQAMTGAYPRPAGFTRKRRYIRLIRGLYQDLYEALVPLSEEKKRIIRLLNEVNSDILTFEANHDLLSITIYLRSLDPMELERRKVMGVNFSHAEVSQAFGRLSFKPVALESLELPALDDRPKEPATLLNQVRSMLSEVARVHAQAVEGLWS